MSLADLRANPPKSRPERSLRVCLAADAPAKVMRLTTELANLPEPDEKQPERPRKMHEPIPQREITADEKRLRDELQAALDEMAAAEGNLGVRANLTDGEWRRWVDAHPAREKGDKGYERDVKYLSGICNADDLIEALGDYAHTWDSDPLTADDWATIFAPVLSGGDKIELARLVASMYESRLDFQQLRSGLSSALRKWDTFDSLDLSASLPSGSTDGNREPSSAATTKTDDPAA